jgi:hypothetical protein
MKPSFLIVAALLATRLPAQVPALPMWSLVPDLRIGADTSEGSLTTPTRLTVGPRGEVVVFDDATRYIYRYNRSGELARATAAPYGCRSIAALGFLGDTLWMAAPELESVLLYAPGAATHWSHVLFFDPLEDGLRQGVPAAMLSGGLAVTQGELALTSRTSTVNFASPIVLLNRQRGTAAIVAAPRNRVGRPLTVGVRTPVRPDMPNGGVSLMLTAQPFQANAVWAGRPDGGGFALVDAPIAETDRASAYVVETFDGDGKRVASRSYAYQPVPVTDSMAENVIRRFVDRLGPAAEQSARDQLVVPKFKPAVRNILMGRDGSTWVQRDRAAGGTSWDVIDPRGNRIAQLAVPDNVFLHYADMTQVVGVERVSDSRSIVVKYTVQR